MNLRRKLEAACILLTGAIIFFSCEIGLGETVDVDKPDISVVKPDVTDFVRDSFVMSGNCSDDTYVESVSVVLKKTGSKEKYGPFEGELSQDKKSWSIVIDNSIDKETGKRKLPDGEYQSVVTAVDSGKRKNEVERTFNIDNTPPVLTLERPATSAASYSPDTYGQKLTLEGTVTDYSSTELIELFFYKDKAMTEPALCDAQGKALPVEIKNPGEKLNIVLGAFGEEGLYQKLYGTEKNGAKIFYGKAFAWDGSRKIPVEEDDRGNCALEFNFAGGGKGSTFSFILNPENNPTYSLSQYESLKKDSSGQYSFYTVPNGTTIGIDVSSGLDLFAIDDDTIEVVAKKCGINGQVTGDAPIVLFKAAKTIDGEYLITDEDEKRERGSKIKTNGSYKRNISVELTKDAGLLLNECYLIEVNGCDINGNSFKNPEGEIYGFALTSSGKLPALKLVSPDAGNSFVYIKADGSVLVKGTATHDETTPKVYVYVGDNEIESKEADAGGNFEFTITGDKFTEGSNIIKVQAVTGSIYSEEKRTVILDSVKPSFSNLQVYPVVSDSDSTDVNKKQYVNGKIKISGVMQDLYGVKESGYKIYAAYIKDGEQKKEIIKDGTNLSYPSFAITDVETDVDFLKQIDSQVDLIVEVSATDEAGNIGIGTLEGYTIDQSTDIPQINISKEIISEPVGPGKWNDSVKLPSMNQLEYLSGAITDDDGIASASLILYEADPETFTAKNGPSDTPYSKKNLEAKSQTRVDFTVQMPVRGGYYYFVIKTADINGKEGSYESFVKITGDAPSISLTTGNKIIAVKNEGKKEINLSGKVSGECSDETPMVLYLLKDEDGDFSKQSSWTQVWSGTDTDWSCVVDLTQTNFECETDGVYSLILRAVDENGKYTDISFNYIIDFTVPTVKITMPVTSEDGSVSLVETKDFTFQGISSDGSGTGVEKVFWKISENGTAAAYEDAEWSNAISGNVSYWSIEKNGMTEGNKILYVYAKDEAGNNSKIEKKIFNLDISKPEISLTSEPSSIVTSKFKFSGTAFDSNSLSASDTIAIYEDGILIETIPLEKIDVANDGAWTSEKDYPSKDEDKKYTYKIKVQDTVGKETVKENIEFVYDTLAPKACSREGKTFLVNNVEYAEGNDNWYKVSNLQLEGYFQDSGSGVKEVVIRAYNGASDTLLSDAEISYDLVKVDAAQSIYKFTALVSKIPSGQCTIKVSAKDEVRESEIKNYHFFIDTAFPEIQYESKHLITNGKEKLTVWGSVSDTGSGVDYMQAYVGTKDNLVSTKVDDPEAKQNRGSIVLVEGSGLRDFSFEIDAPNEISKWFKKETLGETPGIFAVVYDKAGNSTSKLIGSITIDDEDPSVSVLLPENNATVNKELTFSGTASDKNGLYKIELQYYSDKDVNSEWQPLCEEITGFNWNIEIDPTSLEKVKDADETKAGVQLKVRAFVTDLAGNTSAAERVVTVDANSDRPTIILGNMTNVGGMGCTLEYKNIFGSVSDDDGVVKDLWITLNESLASNPESYPSPLALASNGEEPKEAECLTKWVKINVDNNTWSLTKEIEDLEDDTEYKLYFYCMDAKGGAFTTMAEKESERVVIKYKDDARSYADKKGSLFSLSTDFPEFGRIEVVAGSSSVLAKNLSNVADLNWRASDNYFFGGDKKYLYAKVEVLSRSAINANTPLTLKINNEDYDISVFNEEKNSGIGNLYLYNAYDVDVNGNPLVGDAKRDRKLYTYIVGPFDLGDEEKYPEDSTAKFSFTAQGGSKRTAIKNINVLTDHSAPVAKIVYPAQNESVSANITVSGLGTDDGAGTGKIEYRIPPETEWRTVSTSSSFKIDFPPEDQPEKNLAYYSKKYYTPENGEAKIPVYFRLTDTLGNTAVQEDQFIVFDANGAVPKCEITYPVAGTSVSGPVKIKGTASGGNGVDKVHLQFLPLEQKEYIVDSTTGARTEKPGTITKSFANETALKEYFAVVKEWPVFKYGEDLFAIDSKGNVLTGGAEENIGNVYDWYVLADGKDSWSKLFNTEVLAEQSGDILRRTTKLGIRAKSFKDGESRDWVAVEADINWESAAIKDLVLVQKKNSEKGLKRNYENGLYIGSPEEGYKWYLEGTFESADKNADAQKLDSISITNILSEAGSVGTETDFESGLSEYNFSLPVNLTGPEGRIQLSLSVTNKAGKETVEIVTFSIDKTAPQLFAISDNLNGGLRLYDMTNEDEPLNESKVVRNSNSFFTFGDNAVDSGSGFSYLAFYFKRNPQSAGNVRIYDPLVANPDASKIRVDIEGNVKINEDNLPVLEATVTRPSATQIKSSELKPSVNPHVRAGGLVKIDGIYCLIKDVQSDGTVTLEKEIDISETQVQVVYAQIVDNTGAKGNEDLVESMVDGVRTYIVRNDDGDGMKESYNVTGGKWTAAIRSDLIPDGPVEIHVVASDKAGNISHGYLNTFVRNNNPRLSKVFLGTDLDGNGKFDFTTDTEINSQTQSGKVMGEFIHYSCLDKNSGEAVTSISLDTDFTIKNQLAVIPEFVGGNGNIKYAYEIVSQENNPVPLKRTDTKLYALENSLGQSLVVTKAGSVKNASSILDSKGFVVISNEKEDSNKQNVKTTLNGKSAKGTKSRFAFTFWDSTEETLQGADSQYAFLSFTAEINTVDRTPPKNHVHKFFWKGLNDNSIFASASARRTTDLLGHIELEDDLSDEIKNKTAKGIVLGNDPKVSGKIVIKGESFDDVKLSSLWVNFANENLNSGFASGSEVAVKTVDGRTYYKAATYNNATATWICSNALMENQKWEFKVLNNTLSQSGHQVDWEFDIDTEIVANQSSLDVNFRILSMDDGYVGSDKTGIASEMDDDSLYKMDVVPYVTQLITNLSTKDEDNPSIYTRSARGRYQVRGNINSKAKGGDSAIGEDITIKGFNLGNEPLHITNISDLNNDILEIDTAAENPHSFNVGEMKSGLLRIEANGIEILNNQNNNAAMGSATETGLENSVFYNMQANHENNNSLTDDLKIDVWEFKNGATKVNSELANPTVRFNPVNGSVGMSYTNGSDFDMPGGTAVGNQYSHFYSMRGTGGFGDSTFAFDKNGYSYGAAQDLYDSGTAGNSGHFRLSLSKYHSSGYSVDDANYGHTGSVRLEANSINTKMYPNANNIEWQSYKNRIVSPQIVAVAEDSRSEKVMLHVAYADTATNQIRYRRSYVNANSVFASAYKNDTSITYDQVHVVPFSPRGEKETVVPDYYRITALPEGCTDESLIGKEVTFDELPANSVKNVHYVDISTSRYLAGSSLRNISDVDSNFQFGVYDLSELLNDDGTFSDYRFPTKMWAVDFANSRIDQTTTANRNSYGNKPMYPYSRFSHGMTDTNSAQEPDSLQNQAGQTIHVLASSGIEGSVMDVYKKNPGVLTGIDSSGNSKTYYKKQKNANYLYNAGRSVALGVSSNGSPIIAWHDNEKNRLNISFNTEEELKSAEDNVAAISIRNGGTGGTLYGKEGTYTGTPTYYACYAYYASSSLSNYTRYYRLYNDGKNKNGVVEDLDENQFVDKAVYSGTAMTVTSANAYVKIPTGMYSTPEAYVGSNNSVTSIKYKVMKMHSTKVRKMKYLTQTITEVFNSSGKLLSTKTEEIERKDDTITTTYADKDELVFTSGNVLTRGGAVVNEWVLNGKYIYTPVNRTVEMYGDISPVDTDVKNTTKVLSEITDPETGNITRVTQKDVNRDYYDIQGTMEFLEQDPDREYHAADSAGVYVSFPVYKLYTNQNEYLGCATENTQLSFDRTEVWEDHTKQIGKGGAFVQMQVVDSTVHLAYYEEDTGSLIYSRVPFNETGFGEAETWTVDGYNDIGENITLDVIKDENGNHIPYIGYYGNKRAKLAYLVDPNAEKLSGSVNDKFTGVWEVLYVPSERPVGSDRINVAVRKDADGKAQLGKDLADGVITANTSATYVYSNATTNPVIGYINALGNLEIGQKR